MPPDLTDPLARAAYARELRRVARPLRYMGMGLALIGVGAAAARHWWPQVPVAVPIFLVAVAALHLAAGVLVRIRYHQARLRQ